MCGQTTHRPASTGFTVPQAVIMIRLLDSVRSLELEGYSALPSSPEAGAALLPPDGEVQAYVDAGSLVMISSSFTGKQEQDVLYSSLLAKLAANKRYDHLKGA